MTAVHSTRTPKPSKPYPEFPFFPHATGRWAKKIRGRLVYFGPWADPEGALNKYLAEKDALHAGRKPREEVSGGVTIRDLCNRFLHAKEDLRDNGEITARSWADYKRTTDRIVAEFGKTRVLSDVASDDFELLRKRLARTLGPVALGNAIQRVRSVFKFAYDAGMIAAPVRFGPGFKRPAKKVIRKARAAKGAMMFEAAELKRMIAKAGQPLKAMILLGINCGFGNADCGTLPIAAVDLAKGWIDYPRPKTGVPRRCPLWPETVKALKEACVERPRPAATEFAELSFLTQRGNSWYKDDSDNPMSKETAKLLKKLGLDGHRNFYTLRHTFRTIADESKDQPAVDFIMGHESPHMASVYRERIGDERLKAVTEYVRRWIFGV